MSDINPTAVIGAGPAGIAAALTLARAGIPVVLIERSDAVGGKVMTIEDPQRRCEHGVHGWWPCYVNFNRLLTWVGIEPDNILRPAEDIRMILEDGRQVPLRPLTRELPSPLFFIVQAFRTPIMSARDALHLFRFGIHILAFDPVRDESLYASWSFDKFLDYVGVTPRAKRVLFEVFTKNFAYSRLEGISASVGLASFRAYVLPRERDGIPRWIGGLSHDVIWGALEAKLQELGTTILKSTTVRELRLGGEDGVEVLLNRASQLGQPIPIPEKTILGSVDRSNVDASVDGVSVSLSGVPVTVRLKTDGQYEALSRLCTHSGCETSLAADRQFHCPCHGGVFSRDGQPVAGPAVDPLRRFSTEIAGASINVLESTLGESLTASSVIIATDVESARNIVARTVGIDEEVRHTMGHLAATSVIVIRLWFRSDVPLDDKPQAALTPLLPMIDVYFCLSKVLLGPASPTEHLVEVQVAAAKANYITLPDKALLALALTDLGVISSDYRQDTLIDFRIQRHINVFSSFPPGIDGLGLPSEIAHDVHVAGDWSPRPGNSWMMERAVGSGVARAIDILKERGIEPSLEILQQKRDGALLRFASLVSFLIRSIVRRGFDMPPQMTEQQMIEHDRVDHIINGWGSLVIGACNLLPLFDSEFNSLLKIWPFVFLALNVYFFFHVEPWVRIVYGSWIRSLSDKHTFQHRIMTGGGLVAAAIEIALTFHWLTRDIFRMVLPVGSIVFGVLFTLHHWGEEPLSDRQHRNIGFLSMAIGICLGLARFFPSMSGMAYVWPVLFLCQAYFFITYMVTTLHGGHVHVDSHEHTHGEQHA